MENEVDPCVLVCVVALDIDWVGPEVLEIVVPVGVDLMVVGCVVKEIDCAVPGFVD